MNLTAEHREIPAAEIPAERCLWAMLPASAFNAASQTDLERIVRSDTQALHDALERWLPHPQADLHPAFAVAPSLSGPPVVVACVVDHQLLQNALDSGVLAAAPAQLHPSILVRLAPGALAPAGFNLLTGQFEPPAIRTARRSSFWIITAGLALLTAIMYFGLNRHYRHQVAQIDYLTTSTQAVLRRLVPDGDDRTIVTRAAAEARRLRAAAAQMGSRQPAVDAAELLALVLSRWPKDASSNGLYITTQSAQIGRNAITFSMTIPASADAEPLIEALAAVPGWTLQQSQRTAATNPSADHSARLVLRLVPTRSAANTARSGGTP